MSRWKEEFIANAQRKCVSVHQNGNFENGKVLYMEPDWTYLDLLHAASQRLNMVPAAKKIFNSDGAEIDDCMMIVDNDILFLSIDDDYIAPSYSHGNSISDAPKNSRAEAEKIPMSIGGYKVGDLLGKGAFGEVRYGEHQLTQEKVAMKFLRKSEIHSLGAAERTNTEIQCLTALKHMNIIRLLQHMESSNHVILIFELMQGGDLMKYLMSRKDPNPPHRAALSEDECKHVFYQILSGVSFAHNQHICHRDLKLENILLKDHTLNQVKIADFGLSDFYRPGATMKSNCGTLSFLAPEVFKGTANAGPPLDVWSLGVILFTILCGRLPFEGTDLLGTKRPRDAIIKSRIIKCQYKIDEHLGPEAKDLVRRMLQVDPVERASVPEIFNHVWVRSASNSHYSDCASTTSSTSINISVNGATATPSSRIANVLSSSNNNNNYNNQTTTTVSSQSTGITPLKLHRRGNSFLLSGSDNSGNGNLDPSLFSAGLNLDPPPAPKSPSSASSSGGTPNKSPYNSNHKSVASSNSNSAHSLSNNGRFVVSASEASLDSSAQKDSYDQQHARANAFSSTVKFSDGDLDLTDDASVSSAVISTFKLVPLRRSNSSSRDGSAMESIVSSANNSPYPSTADQHQHQQSPTPKLANTHRSHSEKGGLLVRPNTAITFLPRRPNTNSPFGVDSDDGSETILVSSHDERGSKKVSTFILPKRDIVSASSTSQHHKAAMANNAAVNYDKDNSVINGNNATRTEYKSNHNKHLMEGPPPRIRSSTEGGASHNTHGTHNASYMNPIGSSGGISRRDQEKRSHGTPHNSGTIQSLFDSGVNLSDSPNTVGGMTTSSPHRDIRCRSTPLNTSAANTNGGGGGGIHNGSTTSSTVGGRVRFM